MKKHRRGTEPNEVLSRNNSKLIIIPFYPYVNTPLSFNILQFTPQSVHKKHSFPRFLLQKYGTFFFIWA